MVLAVLPSNDDKYNLSLSVTIKMQDLHLTFKTQMRFKSQINDVSRYNIDKIRIEPRKHRLQI